MITKENVQAQEFEALLVESKGDEHDDEEAASGQEDDHEENYLNKYYLEIGNLVSWEPSGIPI
jgi:hypothetical protein